MRTHGSALLRRPEVGVCAVFHVLVVAFDVAAEPSPAEPFLGVRMSTAVPLMWMLTLLVGLILHVHLAVLATISVAWAGIFCAAAGAHLHYWPASPGSRSSCSLRSWWAYE